MLPSKGGILLPDDAKNITITVRIQNGDVRISRSDTLSSLEDKRLADQIEAQIKLGFAKYHIDKRDQSIDV